MVVVLTIPSVVKSEDDGKIAIRWMDLLSRERDTVRRFSCEVVAGTRKSHQQHQK